MLNVEEAVECAKRQLAQVFPEFASNGLRLEELESPLLEGRWKITFSSVNPSEPASANLLLDAIRTRRNYKTIELEKDTGILVAVRNKAA